MYHASKIHEHVISKVFMRYRFIIRKIPCTSCWI